MLKLLKTLSRVGISELVDFVGGNGGDDSTAPENGADGWFHPARVHALEDRRVLAVNVTPNVTTVSTNEGTQITLSATFTDTAGDTHRVTVNWGDGSSNTSFNVTSGNEPSGGSPGVLSASHTYVNNGSYTATITVTDRDPTPPDSDSATVAVTVADVAPTIDNTSVQLLDIDEGEHALLTFDFDDPGINDTYTIEVDWGTGTFVDVTSAGTLTTGTPGSHSFSVSSPGTFAAGSYAVLFRVTDAIRTTASDSGSATLTVNNVTPALANVTLPAINEGSDAQLDFNVVDPGSNDTYTVEVNWGSGWVDVTASGVLGAGGSTHFTLTSPSVFGQNGTQVVGIRVLDSASAIYASASPTLTINDVAPSIGTTTLPAINEGSAATLTVHFFDPGLSDTFKIEVNWGTGSGFVDVTTAGTLTSDGAGNYTFVINSPVYVNNGTFSVQVRVTDAIVTTATDTASTSLTVNDVAPVIDPTSISLPAINEGQTTTLSFDFFDPGLSDTYTISVDWGSGTFVNVTTAGTLSSDGAGNHTFTVTTPTFAQNGTFTVRMRVTDAVTTTSTDTESTTLTVNDVAPTIIPASINLPAINEGQSTQLTFQFTDPGLSDAFTIEVDWGTGLGFQDVTTQGSLNSLGGATRTFIVNSPVYDQDGTYSVQMRVTDADIGSATDTASASLVVADVPPTLGTISLPAVNEGQQATLTFDVTDPGGDAFVVQVDWGDGNGFVAVTGTSTGGGTMHFALTSPNVFPQNGAYTLQVRVLNTALSTIYSTASPVLTVNDVPPAVVPGSISLPSVNEGQATSLSFTFFDPGLLDTHKIEVDWGDGTFVDVTSAGFSTTDGLGNHFFTVGSPVYGQDGVYTVRIRVTDTVTTTSVGTATTPLIVNDVAPVIDPASISLPATSEGDSTTLTFSFFDPGLSDSFTIQVDWGTGGGFVTVPVESVSSDGAGNYTVSVLSPNYAQDGVFTVRMRVTDSVRTTSTDTETATLLVADVPPAIDPTSIVLPAINEGQHATLTFDVIDPGLLDVFVVQVDWGDGNGFVTVGSSRLFGRAHQFSVTSPNAFAQDGTQTVQIRVLDLTLITVFDTASPTLTVLDVPPVIDPASVTLPTVAEGQATTLQFEFFDPGVNDSYQVEVEWSAGGGFVDVTTSGVMTSDGAGNYTFTVTSPTYAQDGAYVVNIRLTDRFVPAAVSTATGSLTVTNVAPQILSAVVVPSAINEGDAVTLQVTFIDPGLADFNSLAPLTVTIDWGDHPGGVTVVDVRNVVLTPTGPGQYTFSVTRIFADDAPTTGPVDTNNITVHFADNVATATLAPGIVGPQLVVNNLPPVLTSALTPILVDSVGVATLTLEFADRGVLDSMLPDMANWDWGGRGVQLGPPTITATGIGTFVLTARFQFTENPPTPGPAALNPIPHFTIQFAVVDKDGGLSIGTIDANVPSGIARFQPEAPAPAPPLNPPQSIAQTVPSAPQTSTVVNNESQAPSTSQSSVESTSAKIVLREVLPSGRERLLGTFDENALDAVLDKLKGGQQDGRHRNDIRLPDRRYRVYMVMPDGSERLIVDVLVRQGQPTDPTADGDDSSPQQKPGIQDRNLWSDSPQGTPESAETKAPQDSGAPAAGTPANNGEKSDADAAANGQLDSEGVVADQIIDQEIGVVRRTPAAETDLAEPVGPRLP